MPKRITHLECHKALKAALSNNFKFHWLDVIFGQDNITWHIAVQLKNDKDKKWYPKIASFYFEQQKVCVMDSLGSKPAWMDIEVLIAMSKPKSPSSPTAI